MTNPRIISGSAKGIRLNSVPGDSTRPITDRVKESLFNIIGNDVIDTNFLDLFSGTGSVGIEALSRGARYALLLDNDKRAYKTINENLIITNLKDKAKVLLIDAFTFLKSKPTLIFEYVYVAPPQYKGLWEKTLILIDANYKLLTRDGWVIVQIDPIEEKKISLNNLRIFDKRKYGSTKLFFYARKDFN